MKSIFCYKMRNSVILRITVEQPASIFQKSKKKLIKVRRFFFQIKFSRQRQLIDQSYALRLGTVKNIQLISTQMLCSRCWKCQRNVLIKNKASFLLVKAALLRDALPVIAYFNQRGGLDLILSTLLWAALKSEPTLATLGAPKLSHI